MISNEVSIARFVDLPDLLARVENDRTLLMELLSIFKEELPAQRDAIHNAMEVSDLPQAAAAAHTLKGMLANMSMKRGASLAADIEAATRKSDLPALSMIVAAFDTEIQDLSQAIDEFLSGY